MAYTGTSIVDYLKSTGQDSSYGARSNLASQYGITNYTGSGEQNLELLNKLQSNTGSVPTITQPKTLETSNTAQTPTNDLLTKALAELQSRITPINVSDITQDKTIPDKALETSYNKTSTTSADSISSLIAKQDEKLQAEKASAQSALSKAGLTGAGNTLQEQLITGYQTKAPQADYQGTLQQYQSQYGVIDALDEYKLQGEKVVQMKAAVENLDLQRQAELDATLNRQASMNSISAEQQRINQKYDSQRAKLVGDYNVEAAVLAAKSNNLSEANNLVSQAVNAYTADISAEIKRFDNLYSIASDWVSSLTSQEQSILDDVKSNLITQKKDEEERLTNVLNLKLQYSNAGIEASDTLEQAVIKAAKIKETEVDADIQKLRIQYVNAGILETDTEEQAINKVVKYLKENPESTARLKYITDDLGNVRVYDESSGTPVLINTLEGAGQGNPQVNIAKNYTDGTYINVKGGDDKVSYEGYYDMLNTFKQMGGGNINTFYSLYPMSDYMDEGNIARWKSFAQSNKIDESENDFSLPLTRPE